MAPKGQDKVFSTAECKRFMSDCLQAVGTKPDYANAQADLLLDADYRGHYSHGMNRLENYINDVIRKSCDPNATPKILKENAATAWVDGCNGLGAVVGNYCMDLAIKKAKQVGVGWVVCKGSNHFGIAGEYAIRAEKAGVIGLAFTNSSPIVVPTRAKKSGVGTCPIAAAAPALNNDSFELDMATCTVALGKIEMLNRKNLPIPKGWALDENSNPTTDGQAAFKACRLVPLGGSEETSGFKGYGLATMIEIFTGIMSGGTYGPYVRTWKDATENEPCNLSQCFVAINPESFAPMFNERVQDLLDYLRKLEPMDKSKPVLVAGDPERIHKAAVDKVGGITYIQNQIDNCNRLAEQLKVKPLKPLN